MSDETAEFGVARMNARGLAVLKQRGDDLFDFSFAHQRGVNHPAVIVVTPERQRNREPPVFDLRRKFVALLVRRTRFCMNVDRPDFVVKLKIFVAPDNPLLAIFCGTDLSLPTYVLSKG